MTTTNINQAEIIPHPTANGGGNVTAVPKTDKPETELRATIGRRPCHEGAGGQDGHYSRLPFDPRHGAQVLDAPMREKVIQVLGGGPGQRTVYRQNGLVSGESSYVPGAGGGDGHEHEGPAWRP